MRALLDTNVVLDVLLDREPFVQEAAQLWEANEQGRYDAFISAITPLNVFYVVRRLKNAPVARQAVAELLLALRVCPLDAAILHQAWALPFTDYEDAVQQASATASLVDAIVTRDAQDYAAATLPVYSPAEFLRQLPAPHQPD
jgi:predicted nucleic acid-binding protein